MSIRRARQGVGVILASVLLWCGLPQAGHAQGIDVLKDQGTISSVDCQGLQFVLSGTGGPKSFVATPATQVFVSSTERLPFCALQQFVGSLAIVWSAEAGNQQVAGRVDVLVFAGNGTVPTGNDTGNHTGVGPTSSTQSGPSNPTGPSNPSGPSNPPGPPRDPNVPHGTSTR